MPGNNQWVDNVFSYLRPFKSINFYFIIYPTAAIFLAIGLIFRGMLGAIIISLILFPIIPDDRIFESENTGIIISTSKSGFMAPCCAYQVKERKLLIFEKDYGAFESEGAIIFDSTSVTVTESEIILTYSTEYSEKVVNEKRLQKW